MGDTTCADGHGRKLRFECNYVGLSYCMCVQMASNDPDLPDPSADPQPGDLIEIFRPAYQHWALYLGDGYIINLTPVGEKERV